MFVNIFFTSFSPYDIQNYVWDFLFPQTKVCLLSATQIPHKICTALSKKMSGLQELLKTWKECISLPISSQPNTTPSFRNLKTQHVKHTSNLNVTLHTFPHCNQYICETLTHSTLHNPEHFTHHAPFAA